MKYLILKTLEKIIMKLSDLLNINESLAGQLSRIETEILAKIATLQASVNDLTAQLADATLTDAQAASVLAVQTAVDELDAIVPDVDPAPDVDPVPDVDTAPVV